MAYVRRGMGIRELAFLGRWRSAVVLTYAEEALESTPANRPGVTTTVDGSAAPGTPCPGTPASGGGETSQRWTCCRTS